MQVQAIRKGASTARRRGYGVFHLNVANNHVNDVFIAAEFDEYLQYV